MCSRLPALIAVLLVCSHARAERVLVLELRNDRGHALRQQIVDALGQTGPIERVGLDEYRAAASKLRLRGRPEPRHLARLAKAVSADVLVDGAIGELFVVRIHGRDGAALWGKELPVHRGKLSADHAQRLAKAIAAAAELGAQRTPGTALPTPSATQPSAPPDDGADLVERIEEDAAPEGAYTPAPPVSASSGADGVLVEARGWTRERVLFGMWRPPEREGPAPFDPYAVPYEQTSGQAQLHLRLRLATQDRYEAVVSGLLSYGLFHRTNLVQNDATELHARYEASLREAYVGLFWRDFDLRIGNQRVAWGRADVFTPNDILNVVDLRDPILAERDVYSVPSFIIRGDLNLGSVTLQAVVQPFFSPSLLDLYGSNWALVQPAAPPGYRAVGNLVSALIHPSLRDEAQAFLKQTELPRDDLTDTAFGVRANVTFSDADFGAYYHYGFTQAPHVTVAPWFEQAVAAIDFYTAQPADLAPLLTAAEQQGAPLTMKYVRRHHVGLDLAGTLGQLGLRLDAAYASKQIFYSPELRSYALPAFQLVFSGEYQTGDLGKAVLLEVIYHSIFDVPPDAVLIGPRDNTVSVSLLTRWTFFDHLELELRTRVQLQPASYLLRPQISWRTGELALTLGAIWLNGEPGTYGNYFSRNRALYTSVKYAF